MITVYDSLESYCYEHNKEMPSNKHCSFIGRQALEEIKTKTHGKFIPFSKTEISQKITVNQYPDDYATIIDEVISRYFANEATFLNQFNKAKEQRIKYFNYDVRKEDRQIFEDVLKEKNMELFVNGIRNEKAQYRISYKHPSELIEFGILFKSRISVVRRKIKTPQ